MGTPALVRQQVEIGVYNSIEEHRGFWFLKHIILEISVFLKSKAYFSGFSKLFCTLVFIR